MQSHVNMDPDAIGSGSVLVDLHQPIRKLPVARRHAHVPFHHSPSHVWRGEAPFQKSRASLRHDSHTIPLCAGWTLISSEICHQPSDNYFILRVLGIWRHMIFLSWRHLGRSKLLCLDLIPTLVVRASAHFSCCAGAFRIQILHELVQHLFGYSEQKLSFRSRK